MAVSQAGLIGSPFRAGLGLGLPIARTSYIRTAPLAYARPAIAAPAIAAPAIATRTIAAAPAIAAPAPVITKAAIAAPAPVITKAAIAAPAVAAPAVVAKAAPVAVAAAPAIAAPGVHATQYHAQDELRNYEFGYQNPNSARTEKGNAELGTVAGSYSYVDGHGLTQKVDYVADALGFRVTGSNGAATYSAGPAVVAAAPAIAAAPALGARLLHKRQAVTGLGYTIPTGHLATAAPVALSAQASREAILETVKLNPGHAVAYRVY